MIGGHISIQKQVHTKKNIFKLNYYLQNRSLLNCITIILVQQQHDVYFSVSKINIL
jgi:hypothetical protein